MLIGEIAARSGLKPSAIRFYEQVGLLLTELNALIARARAMKRELELVMQCQCMDVEQCGRAIQRAVEGRDRPGK